MSPVSRVTQKQRVAHYSYVLIKYELLRQHNKMSMPSIETSCLSLPLFSISFFSHSEAAWHKHKPLIQLAAQLKLTIASML